MMNTNQFVRWLKDKADDVRFAAMGAVDDALFALETAAPRAAMQLAQLPRPLRDISQGKLVMAVGNHSLSIVLQIISLRTGRTLSFGLVDNRLNRSGKAVCIVALATSTASMLAVAHELFVRRFQPTLITGWPSQHGDAKAAYEENWRRFLGNETS